MKEPFERWSITKKPQTVSELILLGNCDVIGDRQHTKLTRLHGNWTVLTRDYRVIYDGDSQSEAIETFMNNESGQ